MNCKHVEELLPLYAGHDLEDERAGLITSHLQSCTQCARAAAEYADANQLLQQFAGPQFSEASFATVRQNVLREIERKSGTQTVRELILGAFQPRMTWAVSTAVLFAVCAFAYYFVPNRASPPEVTRANAHSESASAGVAGGSPEMAISSPNPELDPPVPPKMTAVQPNPGKLPDRSRLNLNASVQRNATRRVAPPAVPEKAVQYSPDEPDNQPFNASLSSDKPMRLEIQTKDPNIRIIWFSQPSKHEGSPTESSKGI
jgi:hypothetical protein